MIRKILYILTVVACVWIMLLYTFQGLRFLLGILLVIPAVCLVFLLVRAPFCSVELEESTVFVGRGEYIRLPVKAVNRGLLPVAGVQVKLSEEAPGSGRRNQRSRLRGVGGRVKRPFDLDFEAKHCGQARFRVTGARIFDCLGLFALPVRKKGNLSVWILPIAAPVRPDEAEFLVNCMRMYQDGEDGDYLVRDYRPGDSLRSVHWKLTARAEELQVRDFQPESGLNLFLHMTEELQSEEKRDLFLDKAFSLLLFMVGQDMGGFQVSWVQAGSLCGSRIESTGDVLSCIRQLLCVEKVGKLQSEEALGQRLRGCHLEADGRLYLGEQCAYEE